jgi:hypothetical protein
MIALASTPIGCSFVTPRQHPSLNAGSALSPQRTQLTGIVPSQLSGTTPKMLTVLAITDASTSAERRPRRVSPDPGWGAMRDFDRA